MNISLLLRKSAERFNAASEAVRNEYGISAKSDRNQFNRLVKIKMAANGSEPLTAVHTNISEANTYVHSKLSA
jgi:hypothetical protein